LTARSHPDRRAADDSDTGHTDTTPTCLFCGQPERVEIFEVWSHEWMFETCCEVLHEQLAQDMANDKLWAVHFLRALDLESLCGARIRRVSDDGGCTTRTAACPLPGASTPASRTGGH
jgi:hypothetical protein